MRPQLLPVSFLYHTHPPTMMTPSSESRRCWFDPSEHLEVWVIDVFISLGCSVIVPENDEEVHRPLEKIHKEKVTVCLLLVVTEGDESP